MLTYDELLAFEKQLLNISQENVIYNEENEFVSILEMEKKKKENQGKLTNLLSSVVDSPEIEIIEEEKEEAESEDIEPSIQISDEITSLLDTPDDQSTDKDTEEEAENKVYEVEEKDTVDETVSMAGFTGFYLPKKLHSLWDDIKQVPLLRKRSTAAEIRSQLEDSLSVKEKIDVELEKDLKEIQSFDLDQYESRLDRQAVRFDEKQIEEIIFQELDVEETKVDDVEAIVATTYTEKDLEDFNKNLKNYGILIQRSVIEIVNSDNLLAIATIFDSVLNSVSASFLQRSCEKILGYSIPELEDTHIYSYEELSDRLTTTRDSVLRVSRRIFRDILPKIAAVLIVLFSSYVWIVQPVRAWIHYRIGYSHLLGTDYEESEKSFRKASSIRYMQRFYFRYADEYISQKKYFEAETKYEQLLFGLDDSLRNYMVEQIKQRDTFKKIKVNGEYIEFSRIVNYRRDGFLELASFVLEYTGDYEFANALYDLWLFENANDSEFKLAKANIYIRLYDRYQDTSYLDSARDYYNIVVRESGFSADSIVQRLRWAVRANNKEAQDYINGIVVSKDILLQLPFMAQYSDAYTELISYFLENNSYEFVPPLLKILEQETEHVSPLLVNFLQAKYAYQTQQYELARQLLEENFSQHLEIYDTKEEYLLRLVELKILQSELVLMSTDNTVQAERYLQEAQVLYEEKMGNISLKEKQNLARLYFLLSKIMLQRRELDRAFYYSERARQEKFESPQFDYQYASIEYLRGNWTASTEVLFKLLKEYAKDDEERKILLFSVANALYMKKNYEAALLYYQEVLDSYLEVYSEDSDILLIGDDLDEFIADDVDHIAMIRNNLGVVLYALYEKYGQNEKYLTQSLNELRIAQSISDNRNRTATVRKVYHDLPALNLAVVLGTTKSKEIQIFSTISEELPKLSQWNDALANYQ